MTEEERRRRADELRGKRQAENRAKGAHRTGARPSAPTATTGREDTNGALNGMRNGAEERPKATDETKPKAAGRTSTSPATPGAGGMPVKATGAAAANTQGTQTKEAFGPPVPESLRHDAEMDRQFVDGFIKARVQGPQALEAWFRTLTKPQETAAPARARWADGQSGTQAREPDARTPPGFLAPQRPQTPDLPEDDGLSGAEETLAQGTNDASLNETAATPDETATDTNDAALNETPATPGEAAAGTNDAALNETPVTLGEATAGTNGTATLPQTPATPDEKVDASPEPGVYGPPKPKNLPVVTDEEPPAYDPQAFRAELDARESAAWQAYEAQTQENTLACTEAVMALYSEPGLTQREINVRTGELEAQRDAANVRARDELNAELQGIKEERDSLHTYSDDVAAWFGREWDSIADSMTDGQYSKAKGNGGLGPLEMLGMIFVKGMTGAYDATIGNASRLVSAYNEGVIHGSTWLCNKALGMNLDADALTQKSILGMATDVADGYSEFLHNQQSAYIGQHATPWQVLTLGMTEQSVRTVTEMMGGNWLAGSFMAGKGLMTAREYASAAEIARVLRSMPSALDAAGVSYEEKRAEGKDVLGSLYYMGFSLALEWGTESELVDKALGMMQPSTWLAKAGVAKNVQTEGGRRMLDYILENVVEEPFKEGGQELLSYIGGELGDAAIFGEQIELSGEEAAASFLGGYLQRVMLSVSSLPAYAKSNQMLREMAKANQPLNAAKAIELLELAQADMKNPMLQSVIRYDVQNAMEAEASMALALSGGVDMTAMEGVIEKAESIESDAQRVQAEADAAARDKQAASAQVQEVTQRILADDGDMKELGTQVKAAGDLAREAGAREATLKSRAEALQAQAKKLWGKVSANVETQLRQVGIKAREIVAQAMEEVTASYAAGDGGTELLLAGTGMTAPTGLLDGTARKLGGMPVDLAARAGNLPVLRESSLTETGTDGALPETQPNGEADAAATVIGGGFNEGTSRGWAGSSRHFEQNAEAVDAADGGNPAEGLQQTGKENRGIMNPQPGDADVSAPVDADGAASGVPAEEEAPGSDAKLVPEQATADEPAADEGMRTDGGEEIVIDTFDGLKKHSNIKGQRHHLNQNAAFRKVIPRGKGICIKLVGNILTDINSAHYNAHKTMEAFWDRYRNDGPFAGKKPTISEYNAALYDSMKAAGLNDAQAEMVTQAAIDQQLEYGLTGDMPVPKIPRKINLRK